VSAAPNRRRPDAGRAAAARRPSHGRAGQADLDAPEPAVLAVDAAVRLDGRTIWQGVSFAISPGTFTAILGPNGIGKTTLLEAIIGLRPLAGGRLGVLGGAPGRRNHLLGYLPQRRSFDPALRVRGVDIVHLGLDGARWGVPVPGGWSRSGRAARQRVVEVVDLVGATAYADRPIGQLSGGEQQRLLLAQALVRRPRLLLLDEPLDSLDLTNQAAMAALVQRICREEQVTVVIVAHDVNPILPYLDQVIYLGRGGAISGTVEEVVTGRTLTELYQTPVEVLRAGDGRLVVIGQPEAPAYHVDRHSGRWRDG
jgi:zinc/manganese transport system ATP-binding protein